MKKIILGLCLIISSISMFSQTGLQDIVVEKVNASPTVAGATTYRVFADMATNWQLQAVFALSTHEMFFQTSTSFYNTPSFGVSLGQNINEAVFSLAPALAYDSYITIGAASTTSLGVLRSVSPTGLIAGTALPTQTVGADFSVPFGAAPFSGKFSTFQGIYNVIGQVPGADAQNRIFIGQFTTTGDFSFEINLQVRNPTTNTVEAYVARDPQTGGSIPEYLFAHCSYTSVIVAPVVSITTPANGAAFNTGDVVNIQATATDANGTVTKVEFFRNGALIGTDLNGADGWSYNWTSIAGSANLTAVATDNDLNTTTSSIVSVSVTTPLNTPPTVSITAPASNATLNLNQAFVLMASASDAAPGSVTKVEFYNGTTKLGEDLNGADGWSYSWTPSLTGNVSITAVATDNGGASTTSAAVNAYVQDPNAGFAIDKVSAICYESDVFCIPVKATSALHNALGFDIPLAYDKNKVHPTGVVYVRNSLVSNYNYVSTYVNIVDATGIMNISLAINGSAPAGTTFNGSGDLICVEFAKTTGFSSVDTAKFSISQIDVSYATKVDRIAVDKGYFATHKDEFFNASLLFWKDNSPIKYVSGTNLITNIFGSVGLNGRTTAVQPNASGNFQYPMTSVNSVKIVRDIASATDVQSVINGADAQLVARVVVNDANYKPSIFQMLAMDVNRDGLVSAGDLTQIMQRAVGAYNEFKQTDNYNLDGTKLGTAKSKDWVFLPSDTIYAEQFRISTNWPFAEAAPGKGYSRYGLPVADTAQKVKIIGGSCPIVMGRTYLGIMLGDINGSYATAPESVTLKSTEKNTVVFDLASAKLSDGNIEVPVYFSSDVDVTSVDFALQYNEESLSLGAIEKNASGLESADYFSANDHTLRFTSYSMKNLTPKQNLVTLRFSTGGSAVKTSDLTPLAAYVNGNPARVAVTDAKGLLNNVAVQIYPNPANSIVNVEVSADAKIVMMDLSGRKILYEGEALANQKHEINVSDIAEGIYVIKVYNKEFVSVNKVVVKK
jgi:hypothetical protein